jgi:hypothetical protein
MPKATEHLTPNTAAADPYAGTPLLAMEEPLGALNAAVRLLGHMACSDLMAGGDELMAVQRIVLKARREIERRWQEACADKGIKP